MLPLVKKLQTSYTTLLASTQMQQQTLKAFFVYFAITIRIIVVTSVLMCVRSTTCIYIHVVHVIALSPLHVRVCLEAQVEFANSL